ncbi:MAG: hypothetical protein ACRDOU_23110 [Streptosporangiaceae bacterium]
MLRLLDARIGSYAEVRPARPGLLRVCAHAPGGAGGLDIAGLRVLLIADLLARTAELGRDLQVLTVLAFAGQPSGPLATFEQAADALGIHPPAICASGQDAHTSLGGPIDIHLVSDDASVDGGQSSLVVRVAAAHMAGNQDEAEAGNLLPGHGHDPLAIRLALMTFPYHQPAGLAEGLLTSARETVGHWRHQVAEWAELPSRPIPAPTAATARAAFGDLDTVRVLALLRELALDAGVPTGAKFETFLFADRILGLDLAREIGQPRG